MPKIQAGKLAPLSFPVPKSQLKALIALAVRAPYGRGEETILDTSVRKFSCQELVTLLAKLAEGKEAAKWTSCLHAVAITLLETARKIPPPTARPTPQHFRFAFSSIRQWEERMQASRNPDAAYVADLLSTIAGLAMKDLEKSACATLIETPLVFLPDSVIVPALSLLRKQNGPAAVQTECFQVLWAHAAQFLLDRSAEPVAAPSDWKMAVNFPCKDEDAKALRAFMLDPHTQIGEFRMGKERRRTLHMVIESYHLDMTHLTERKGSPHTLVCTKTRRTYERMVEQRKKDLAAMSSLLAMAPATSKTIKLLAARLKEVVAQPA